MKVTKRKPNDIWCCYCVASTRMNYENHVIYASKGPDVVCEMFSGKSFERKGTTWERAGGCMSIIPIPDREGESLVVRKFYLKVPLSLSRIVWGRYTGGGFVIEDILQLPYTHHFDTYRKNGVSYLIGATTAVPK